MPPSFLEDFFALGYECYYIGNDARVSIKKKIETILTLFKDVIIFVNIDFPVSNLKWASYLQDLVTTEASPELFGIMFQKRQTAAEKELIEKQYFQFLGLKRGYIQLEYQKKFNFELIARALYNNQAQGRRKTIRALCTSACTYKFVYNSKEDPVSGSLQDISLSHFSILAKEQPLKVKLYEKISDIHFNIRGSFFQSDAILVMERPATEGTLYVFSFVNSTGANGLDERTRSVLVPVLYNMISGNCINLLQQYFYKEDNKKSKSASELEGTDPGQLPQENGEPKIE